MSRGEMFSILNVAGFIKIKRRGLAFVTPSVREQAMWGELGGELDIPQDIEVAVKLSLLYSHLKVTEAPLWENKIFGGLLVNDGLDRTPEKMRINKMLYFLRPYSTCINKTQSDYLKKDV